MPPLVLNRYLSTEHRAVRVGLYYLTWTAYYLSFLVSPGLLTIVQLVVMLVDFVLPNVAAWIEHDVRGRLSSCRFAKLESTPLRPLRAPATGPTTVISNAVDWITSWCRSSLPSRGESNRFSPPVFALARPSHALSLQVCDRRNRTGLTQRQGSKAVHQEFRFEQTRFRTLSSVSIHHALRNSPRLVNDARRRSLMHHRHRRRR